MPPNRSKYALNLQAITDKQAKLNRKGHRRLDRDEPAAGRKVKRTRVSEKAPVNSNEDESGYQVASGSTESQPRPTAGNPSQNVNGSEYKGRKAREDFVTQTLNAATASQSISQEKVDEHPQNLAVVDYEYQPFPDDDRPLSPGHPLFSDEDVNMEGGSSEDESEDEPEDKSEDDATDDATDDAMDDATFLKLFKGLCKCCLTKETKTILLSTLEELVNDAEAARGTKKGKRKARKSKAKQDWVQSDDYVCTDGPRPRDKCRVSLLGYIRVVIYDLLKVTEKDQLPPGPPPEVAAPTAAAFYFRWNESEKSKFNAIAARIVAQRIMKDWPLLSDIDEVFNMATEHFKYLPACYQRQNVPEVMAKEHQRHCSANANTRKHTLYKHRLQIIKTVPALVKHGQLIETLGIEGTSSDEESPRRGIYTVRRKRQLSSKVQHLKRQLDQAYAIHFKGPGTKGNQLRQRIDTGLVSTRRFRVTGLPLSCMDAAWLATLTSVQKDMLKLDAVTEYDFSFPTELLETPE
ncbi:hypothetical protein FS749_012087 [Ceratobasidium sp. UAMH 11750]|nr:hypothetical protein FS749_012087 [Ceratobasidium sp. UAMH 11750]